MQFTQRVLSVLVAASAPVLLLLAGTATADAAPTGCGANEYVESIDVTPKEAPDFAISLTPTDLAKSVSGQRDATVSMWHQVQGCVDGLYGGLADSIWQQLECHQMYPVDLATGPTWDFESYRAPLANPGPGTYFWTRCLNKTSLNGPENGRAGLGNNFPGYLDVQPPDNVG